MTHTKCGYVAIVGRPNVGKSTLLNALLAEKISIVSPKPQTTRWQILGIKTTEAKDDFQAQIIYIDTPGIHKGEQRAMNRYMNRVAQSVVMDANVIIFLIDVHKWSKEDEMVLQQLEQVEVPVILAINKVDALSDKNKLLPLIEKLKDLREFEQIIPISAKTNTNTEVLEQEVIKHLPDEALLYPPDQLTDRPIRFLAAEIIREKLIYVTDAELPYTTTVEIEEFKEEETITRISAIIWVERQGQKVIVIGKGGERLKKIGTLARKDIEKLIDSKVFLRLWIKVKADWTDSERALRSFGYE